MSEDRTTRCATISGTLMNVEELAAIYCFLLSLPWFSESLLSRFVVGSVRHEIVIEGSLQQSRHQVAYVRPE